MLSRAFVKPAMRRVPHESKEWSLKSSSIFEHEDFLFGFMDDIPLIPCSGSSSSSEMTLRQVLRASVGVIGESPLGLGMTEKVVVLGGKISAVKRFKRVVIRRNEFGRRVQRVAMIGNECHYLVPLTAYLYAKRIKFVVSQYYPMGSLAHLLSGAREEGHTGLAWKHRYKIAQCIAKAIAFIHSQSPSKERHLKLNVHGNIKPSNVMVDIDFSARLSDYGFVQLADRDTGQPALYDDKLSQESDVYNFGVVLMELLGWPDATKTGHVFEFSVGGEEEEKQVSNVVDIALRCRNTLPHARPTITDILI